MPRNQTRRLTRDDPGRFGLERAFGEGRGELRQLMQQQAQILTALGEIQAAVVAGRPVTGDAGGDAGGDGDEWQGRALRAEAACAHAMRVLAERRARLEELAASLEALEAEVGPGEASRRLVEVLRSGRTERPVD